jgi:hypothetical protein
MSEELSADNLVKAVPGDFEAFAIVIRQPHAAIQACRASLPELVLPAKAVRQVLQAFQHSEITPEEVQKWASFVRRGYVTGTQDEAVIPIDIEFEASAEDEITDIIARLDEIGDRIDGKIGSDELAQMVRSVSRPFPEVV